jgi:TPR repeat protein
MKYTHFHYIIMFETIEEISNKHDLIFDNYDKELHAKIIGIFNGDKLYEKDMKNKYLLNMRACYLEIKHKYNDAEKYYLLSVELGFSDAMSDLAEFYLHKRKNKEKAIEYYLKAIELNHPDAMNNLGFYYYNNKDFENAKKYYSMGIIYENIACIMNLAYLCKQQEKNMDDAIKYFLLASKLNNSDSTFEIAEYYYEQKNFEKSIEYYLKAHEQGDLLSVLKLGLCYEKIKEYIKMEEYFLKAIELNNGTAMLLYGIHCHEIKEDYNKGNIYLLKAIEQNNYEAMFYLSQKYIKYNMKLMQKNIPHSNQQICESQYYLKKLLNIQHYNNCKTKYLFGMSYWCQSQKYMINKYFNEIYNIIVHKNITDIDTEMLGNIGIFYQTIMPNNNYSKCIIFFEKAIELGDVKSMINLGVYYEKFNIKLMEKYYEMAIELNSSDAMVKYGYYLKRQQKYDLMKKYYEMAIKLENSDALINMAEYQYSVDADGDKAKEYFTKAFFKNNDKTIYSLKLIMSNIEQYSFVNSLKDSKEYEKLNVDDNNNNAICNALIKIKQLPEVKQYIKKINFAKKYNIMDKCLICLDEEQQICLCIGNCMHMACDSCYVTLKKCPFCNN